MLKSASQLLLGVALAAIAHTQETTRFDIASFRLPDGWTLKLEPGKAVLDTPDHDAAIMVEKSRPLDGTLAELGTELLAEAAKLPQYRLEVPGETGTHARSKGEWHRAVYSIANPDDQSKFRYVTMITVAGGGRGITFRMTTDSVAGYEAHREQLGRMVDGVRLTTTERIERGNPPLTRFMLDECVDFVEWLVHSPLTAAQRETLETELRGYWKNKASEEIDGIVKLLSARTELAKLPAEKRELLRQMILDETLKSWRDEKDSPSAKMMLAIHDAANVPIDKGTPVLTRQSLAAFGEFLLFAAGQVSGTEAKMTDELRDGLVAAIVDGSTAMSTEQRTFIASMPMTWAALRVAWPDMAEPQRHAMIDGWRQQTAIAALGAALRKQDEQKKAAAAAANLTDITRRQAEMNMMQTQYRTMQNMMQEQMFSIRIMASNLSSNTTYTYRW